MQYRVREADMINQYMIKQYRIFSCIKCGRCVSSCPIARSGEAYSPMVIVEKALLDLNILEDKDTWLCFTCQACLNRCPSDVKFSEFIEAVRNIAKKEKITSKYLSCGRCGRIFTTKPIIEYVKKLVMEKQLNEEFLTLCPNCRKHALLEKWRYT